MEFLFFFYQSHANVVPIGQSLAMTMTLSHIPPAKTFTYTTIEGMMGTKQIEISIVITLMALTYNLH